DRLGRDPAVRPGADHHPVPGARQERGAVAGGGEERAGEAGARLPLGGEHGADARVRPGHPARALTVTGDGELGVRGGEVRIPPQGREVERHRRVPLSAEARGGHERVTVAHGLDPPPPEAPRDASSLTVTHPPARRNRISADRPDAEPAAAPARPVGGCPRSGAGRVRGMSYRGAVTPGGPPAVRELPDLVITKLSVGPMDNNAYLLRCRRTGEQLLIDAANEADRLLELIGDAGLATVVTTHQHRDHWGALAEVVDAT